MQFSSLEFFVFLLLASFSLMIRKNTAQKLFLLIASYYFYAIWDWRFIGLLIFITVSDFSIARFIATSKNHLYRKYLLFTSIAINLSVLAIFKYFNFFVGTFKAVFQQSTVNLNTLDIILPLGISFYIFQTLSYVIDVYRKEQKPCANILDYALFLAFFPKLIAGPIIRAKEFLPQLDLVKHFDAERLFSGFRRIVIGLVKKVLIADHLGQFVNITFANTGDFNSITTWLSVVAYTLQIYFDFSGYTDIAIGSAKILGYDLPENFNKPYSARSIRDFWKRWHITLSSWLRDYIYIPLGGNRKGQLRTYINIMITMTLCGLWHGASWTFVFWGAWHGLAMSVNRFMHNNKYVMGMGNIFSWVLTMITIMLGWIFFRAQTFSDALLIINRLFSFQNGIDWISPIVLIILFIIFILFIIQLKYDIDSTMAIDPRRVATATLLCFLLWMVIVFQPKEFAPFIYGQF